MVILFGEELIEREQAKIDIEDRGYQFGDGIYEVIRVYNGQCYLMKEHLRRLQQSASSIELSLPYPIEECKAKLQELVGKNKVVNGTIYVQVSRGVAPRTHHYPNQPSSILVAYTNYMERPTDKTAKGVQAILTDDIRWLRCDIKSLNLLGNVMAKQKAKSLQVEEAIQHRDGVVSEGSSTNVYMVKNEVIYTHPANHYILNGITRMEVIRLAKGVGLPLVEETFTAEQLLEADEVFLTSTTIEVCPVTQIDNTTIGSGDPGPVLRKLQKEFEKSIYHHCYQNVNIT